ncbi:hypothetical protein Mapa_001677 [Marchantia paleacea]|nr:hypothetical protein Mapa_001677 [Marchantia paleacea]
MVFLILFAICFLLLYTVIDIVEKVLCEHFQMPTSEFVSHVFFSKAVSRTWNDVPFTNRNERARLLLLCVHTLAYGPQATPVQLTPRAEQLFIPRICSKPAFTFCTHYGRWWR